MYGKTAAVSAGAGGAVLAFTGLNSALGMAIGASLLIAGAVLVRLAFVRRRRA